MELLVGRIVRRHVAFVLRPVILDGRLWRRLWIDRSIILTIVRIVRHWRERHAANLATLSNYHAVQLLGIIRCTQNQKIKI